MTDPASVAAGMSVLVITTSDRSAAGEREDTAGALIEERLRALGYAVDRLVVPDDQGMIESALVDGSASHRLIVTSGGTGLTPRDVTPQATLAVLDYEVPGIAEAMRAEGRLHTPMAALSRAVAGVRGRTLVVNVPGSPKAAGESLDAIVPVLRHALETIAGPFDHGAQRDRGDLPGVTADGPGTGSGPRDDRPRH